MNIKDVDAKGFVWKNIVTRFGIPHTLILDNGLQFYNTMGEHEDVDHIEDMVVEENRDTCLCPDPTPEWFTKNTWDNMFDPSLVMQAEVSSWMPEEQLMKGMVFTTKLAV